MEPAPRHRLRDSIPSHPFFPITIRESGSAWVRHGHVGGEVLVR